MKMEVNIKPRLPFLIVVLVLFYFKNYGQPINLVNNPSFEYTLPCGSFPTFAVINWSAIYGSPDYFNDTMICPGNGGGFHNFWADGVQYARTGNAYVGFDNYALPHGSNYREAIQTKLIDTLLISRKYCVSFYVNLANKARFATDDIGCYFSPGSSIPFPAPAQIYNTQGNVITDTANWILINKVYAATGNETYMNIGNFKTDANTTIYINNPGEVPETYYFIDDVSVYELPEIDAGADNTISVGGNIQLNASCTGCWSGLQYRWFPSNGLSDTTILNPIASPGTTTTYYFGLIDPTGTITCMVDYLDSVTISVTGINEIDFANMVSVFPNPSEGNFDIIFPAHKNYKIEIINNLGACVYTEKVNTLKYTVNATFDSGLYILKITEMESKKYTYKKIIISK